MKIGVFLDLSNLYYCTKTKFDGSIDYRKYMNFCKTLGTLTIKRAYGSQLDGQADGFIHILNNLGIVSFYKEPKTYHNKGGTRTKADVDVNIAIGIVEMVDHFDTLVLGSADGDLVPAVEYVLSRKKKVITLACNISKELKEKTVSIEISETLLRSK